MAAKSPARLTQRQNSVHGGENVTLTTILLQTLPSGRRKSVGYHHHSGTKNWRDIKINKCAFIEGVRNLEQSGDVEKSRGYGTTERKLPSPRKLFSTAEKCCAMHPIFLVCAKNCRRSTRVPREKREPNRLWCEKEKTQTQRDTQVALRVLPTNEGMPCQCCTATDLSFMMPACCQRWGRASTSGRGWGTPSRPWG